MNKGYYSKLLKHYQNIFSKGYDDNTPFTARVSFKPKKGCTDRNRVSLKGEMASEYERNEVGDICAVSTEASTMQLTLDRDESKTKFKVGDGALTVDSSCNPDQTKSADYEHTFGIKASLNPTFIWNLCGDVNWSLYGKGHYKKTCYNELSLGYEGATAQDNKGACAVPNRAAYSNATVLDNGFFLGGKLAFNIDEKVPNKFEKLVGYANDDMMVFAKHESKGWANEAGEASVGGLYRCECKDAKSSYGFGARYNFTSQEPEVSVGMNLEMKDSEINFKVKQENTRTSGEVEIPLGKNVTLVAAESLDLVALAKNPRDGDSHNYKFGVSLVYSETL